MNDPQWAKPPRAYGAVALVLGLILASVLGFSVGREVGVRDAERAGEPARRGPSPLISPRPVPIASPAPSKEPSPAEVIGAPTKCPNGTRDAALISQRKADGPLAVFTSQAAAQTFSPPGQGLALTSVAPVFAYATGREATLEIYEVRDAHDPTSGRSLARLTIDPLSIPTGRPARVQLHQAIPMRCGHLYSFVIGQEGDGDGLGLQATAFPKTGNVYLGGAMFLGSPGRWKDTGGDMAFQLSFGRAT